MTRNEAEQALMAQGYDESLQRLVNVYLDRYYDDCWNVMSIRVVEHHECVYVTLARGTEREYLDISYAHLINATGKPQ